MQHKPTADADVAATQLESKVFDPFAPPYNANLHVGDLKDEVSQEEYAILVSLINLSRKISLDFFFDI